MRKYLFFIVLLVVASGYVVYQRTSGSAADSNAANSALRGGPGGPGGAFARPPMTVELVPVSRASLSEFVTIVGNLIGAQTVDVVPKVNGRLEAVLVRLGDTVSRGQQLARVEDREILEQVKQADASFDVGSATIRQREADLKFADTNLERSRNLFERQLLPRQTLDDAEARYQASNAQLDLARAQFEQARARRDELRITLSNTVIVSPVDGFVGKRYLDAGAFASTNAPVVSVVDIRVVRLVANIIEKDLRRVNVGVPASVDVDAFPGESFEGRVARIAPVLDPATRTAEMEVEIPNPGYRLRPGMYARVRLKVATRDNALVVPRNAIVDLEGRRGVFVAREQTAHFLQVSTGIQDDKQIEILQGVSEGDPIVTTGSSALRDGDRILLPGPQGGGPGQRPGGQGGPGGQPRAPGAGQGGPGQGARPQGGAGR